MIRTEQTTLDDGSTVERTCGDEGVLLIERIRRPDGTTEERIYSPDGTLEIERFSEPDGLNVQRRFYKTGATRIRIRRTGGQTSASKLASERRPSLRGGK